MGVNQVVPADINKAAAKIEDAANTVRQNIPTEVKQISDALPDSASAGPASSLSASWQKRFNGWAKSADTHAQKMKTCAKNWGTLDEQHATAANKKTRALGGK